MWPILGGLISGAASMIGGIFQNNSAQSQALQAEQFQAQQTNTSYQRATKDMEAAGLNPILAYSQGGASSAAGQAGQVQNVGAAAASGFNSGVNSAQAAQIGNDQVEQVQAQTAASKAQAVNALASAKLTDVQATTAQLQQPGQVRATNAAADYNTMQTLNMAGSAEQSQTLQKFYSSDTGKLLTLLNAGGQDVAGATSALKNVPLGGAAKGLVDGTFKALGY